MQANQEARKLWPYLLPMVQRVAGSVATSATADGIGGAPSPHALDSAHHTGTLTAAQGPLFLLVDGSRALTGNLAVDAAVTIDGVDLSAHAADPDAHHARATAGNTGISVTGQAISAVLATVSGMQISSGLKVGEGDGINVLSSTVEVDVTDIFDGLYGLDEDSNNLRIKKSSNSGLAFGMAGGIELGTPTSISATSANGVSGVSHVHAVTASSDVSAGVAALLKSTGAGGLGLASLFTTGAADIGQGFTAGNTGFRVIYHTHDYPHTHVVVNPTGGWTLDEQFGLDVDDNLLVRGWIVGKHAIQIEAALMLCHYDGPGPYETNFKGNPTGHLGQVAYSDGGVIYRPGKFAKAAQLAPGTTNYITNPSFETGTTGWTHGQNGTGSALSQSSVKSFVGTYSAYMNGSSTGNASATSPTFNAIGNWYATVQARVWAKAGTTVELLIYDTVNAVTRATVTNTLTEDWELMQCSWFCNVGTVACSVRIRVIGGGNSSECWFDAVQAERGATQNWVSPYCDGSLGGFASNVPDGSGHAWSGTAHASASSRVSARLSYLAKGNLTAERGSVIAWVNAVDIIPSTAQYVLGHYNSGNRIYLFIGTNGNWWIGMGSSATLLDSGEAALANTWTFLALTWDGTTAKIYIDAGDGGIDDDPTASSAYSGLTEIAGNLWVGTDTSAANQFNGLICELSTVDRAMPGNEIRAIYESQAPVFAEASTWHWRAGRNRIYADAEGLWGYGASGGTILGLYAGDDANPAATKSWGGKSLSEGDFLLGRYGAANGGWLYFDQDLVGGNPGLIFGYADKDVIRFDSGGASLYGVLDIDTNGGIYQGTGTFASPTTGLKIYNSSGVGKISGYNGGVQQWYADTDGKLYAGAGNVVLDSGGIALALNATAPIRFVDGAGATVGSLQHKALSTPTRYELQLAIGDATRDGVVSIEASDTGSVTDAIFVLDSTAGGASGITTFGGNNILFFANAGEVEIGPSVYMYQLSATGAVPVLTLEQLDLSEEFIQFNGSVSGSNPINTTALGSYYGRVRVSVNGTMKWLALYN